MKKEEIIGKQVIKCENQKELDSILLLFESDIGVKWYKSICYRPKTVEANNRQFTGRDGCNIIVVYQSNGYEILNAKDFLDNISQSLADKQAVEFAEDKIKEIAYISWKAAANAHRLYPDNKHTFVDFWDASKADLLAKFRKETEECDHTNAFPPFNDMKDKMKMYCPDCKKYF